MDINQEFENILANFADMDKRIAAIPGETADMPRDHVAPYLYIEKKRDAYDDASNDKEKVEALKNLIAVYLYFKDFVYAEKYIKQYTASGYDEDGGMAALWDALCELLERIKIAVAERKEKAVIVFLLDAFGLPVYEKMPKTSFIRRLADKSLLFTNMYSTAQSTRCSFISIFYESYLYNGDLYKKRTVSRQDCEFFTKLKSRGVFFGYYSLDSSDYIERDNYTGQLLIQPTIYWNMLTDLAGRDECMFLLTHSLETHIPYFNGYSSNRLVNCLSIFYRNLQVDAFGGAEMDPDVANSRLYNYDMQQHYDALVYADSQVEFFYNIAKTNLNDIIVMSDHEASISRAAFDENLFLQEFQNFKFLITFMINSSNIEPGINDKLSTYNDFCKIIDSLLDGKSDFKIPKYDYIRYDSLPQYSKDFLLVQIKRYGHPIYGYTKITKENTIYRFLHNGNEELSDTTVNAHDNMNNARYYPTRQANRERLEYFRSLIDYDPREIWRYLFEKYPHMPTYYPDILEKLECNLRYMNDFSIIDNGPYIEEFERVWNELAPDEPVAIFGMGLAFEILYTCVIESTPRRNVVCVIDNTYCKQRDSYKGFTIVSTEGSKGYEYSKMFINGFTSRDAMYADLAEHGITAEVIDIYDILDKRGMPYKEPFMDYSYYDDLQLRKNAK